MRRLGHSYAEILKVVQVSKSTLSLWLREIELTSSQQKKLLLGRARSRYMGAKAQQRKRVENTKIIIESAKKEFQILMKNPLFLSGLSLYWAEGDKNSLERVKFTNADSAMIQLMMHWFREICKVPEKKFRIALHVHDLHIRPHVKRYWSKLTRISESRFHKIYVKPSSLRQRRNILYNGTCGIVVNDRRLFRRIVGWRLGLLDHFGISPRSSTDRTKGF